MSRDAIERFAFGRPRACRRYRFRASPISSSAVFCRRCRAPVPARRHPWRRREIRAKSSRPPLLGSVQVSLGLQHPLGGFRPTTTGDPGAKNSALLCSALSRLRCRRAFAEFPFSLTSLDHVVVGGDFVFFFSVRVLLLRIFLFLPSVVSSVRSCAGISTSCVFGSRVIPLGESRATPVSLARPEFLRPREHAFRGRPDDGFEFFPALRVSGTRTDRQRPPLLRQAPAFQFLGHEEVQTAFLRVDRDPLDLFGLFGARSGGGRFYRKFAVGEQRTGFAELLQAQIANRLPFFRVWSTWVLCILRARKQRCLRRDRPRSGATEN